jgi:hypothetical protein
MAWNFQLETDECKIYYVWRGFDTRLEICIAINNTFPSLVKAYSPFPRGTTIAFFCNLESSLWACRSFRLVSSMTNETESIS